ncbi:hypothetical protein [Pseudodesulfovibrio sp. JC047]|uniref:hypothetical protein n=1 Tax=Pseudodesulfovibrio sp. JC047 TaxID=2683199 RepID=UPI001EF3A834|nr:hypothetical protein [Pseudodesulfovibrio sp. JC047]
MQFKEAILQARSQIAIILGLLSTGVIIFLLTDLSYLGVRTLEVETNSVIGRSHRTFPSRYWDHSPRKNGNSP